MNNTLNKETQVNSSAANGNFNLYIRVFQSKQLYAVETETGTWYVINSKKNRYKGKYYGNIPFQCTTVIPTPLYMIDSIFPRLKDKLVLTPWLLGPTQQ